MKREIDFDKLENAGNEVIDRIAKSSPALDSKEKERIFAMSRKKMSESAGNENDEAAEGIFVSGVDTYRKSWLRFLPYAASLLIVIAGIGAGRAFLNRKEISPDTDIVEDAATAEVTTSVTEGSGSAAIIVTTHTSNAETVITTAAAVTSRQTGTYTPKTTSVQTVQTAAAVTKVKAAETTASARRPTDLTAATVTTSASRSKTTSPALTQTIAVSQTTAKTVTTAKETTKPSVTTVTAQVTTVPVTKRKMTSEDFRGLVDKGYDLSWSDLAEFEGEDVGSGIWIMKYDIENFDDIHLIVGGLMPPQNDEIYYAHLETDSYEDTYGIRKCDIRSDEFKEKIAEILSDILYDPEDTEDIRADALRVGEYMLTQLKNGNFTLDTELSWNRQILPEGLSSEIYTILEKGNFSFVSFVDEHTVHIMLNKGLLDSYGYLVTDGTISFAEGSYVSVPGIGYDGGSVYIDKAYGNIYYFSAGT